MVEVLAARRKWIGALVSCVLIVGVWYSSASITNATFEARLRCQARLCRSVDGAA